MNPYAILFEPQVLGTLTVPNRIVMAPMTRRMATEGGVPTADMAAYYRRRAEGGVGLIITEGTAIAHPAADPDRRVPALRTDEQVDAWRRVADGVHEAGGLIATQLWHVGSRRDTRTAAFPDAVSISPSPEPYRDVEGRSYQESRAMTHDDIAEAVAAYGESARRAKDAGFDAVEIHGAHGYLIDQFLDPETNRREDEYGGSPENRARFAAEVTAAVRAAVGPGFPIIFRFSQFKIGQWTAQIAASPAELARILCPIAEAGVDSFHASQRDHAQAAWPPSPWNLAAWAQAITGRPGIAVGKVALTKEMAETFRGQEGELRPLDELLAQLHRGDFAFIAIGRALIGDPALPNKLRDGKFGEVRGFERKDLEGLG